MESYKLGGKVVYYFDLNSQTIARIPTKSNLKFKGSDNSLYFGLISNKGSKEILCALLKNKNIEELNGHFYEMLSYGLKVQVELNINKEGQIQLKLGQDGLMRRLFLNYQMTIKEEVAEDKVLLVIDFKHHEIRFKKIKDLEL